MGLLRTSGSKFIIRKPGQVQLIEALGAENLRVSFVLVDRNLLSENLVKSSLSGFFCALPVPRLNRSIDKPALLKLVKLYAE
ncbi:hypothetical protein TNCV_3155561 [Trichonephila clavipes]|nr:hypothetical protein TNCV_3155561 [Trichonephila clavipes]